MHQANGLLKIAHNKHYNKDILNDCQCDNIQFVQQHFSAFNDKNTFYISKIGTVEFLID